MDKQEIATLKSQFDELAHVDNESHIEFWFARELQSALGYARWENFETAIHRAKAACQTTGIPVSDHFRDVTKMVTLGSGSSREITDIKLTRYACYLIAQNGDPRKDKIAFAQIASACCDAWKSENVWQNRKPCCPRTSMSAALMKEVSIVSDQQGTPHSSANQQPL